MTQIADGARPRFAVTRDPKGWLEPGNLKHMAPVSVKLTAFARENPDNPMLFVKSDPAEYQLLSESEFQMQVFMFLSKPGGAVVVDDGVFCKTICRPGPTRRVVVVDPHDTKKAKVADISDKLESFVKAIAKNGAMCLGVERC